MSVAIVIPCYKQAHFLPATVASVCAQTYTDLEIVIVDDGSPDDTAAVAERLITAFPERDIRLVRQRNQGLAASRNNGIATTSAEYALVLDSDDLIAPTFVEDCVRVLDARLDLSIAYGQQRYFGEENHFTQMPEYDFVLMTRRNLFPCTALYRRRAFDEVGGYNERMTSYEDWDFWLGCGERGHFGVFLAHAVFCYRKSNASMLAEARGRDTQLKAQIVLNHPLLFSPEQAAWAQGALAGDPAALRADQLLHIMPELGEMATRPPRSGGAIDGARRFATLAAADEVLQRPELLAGYGEVFGGHDDATLVIAGTHDHLASLGPLVERLGLDGADATDLVGLPVEEGQAGLASVAARVDALLTGRPLRLPVPLPRVDGARVAQLRALAAAA
jgi:Glycosyl transferase family 2